MSVGWLVFEHFINIWSEFFDAGRGAAARGVTAKPTGCGFDPGLSAAPEFGRKWALLCAGYSVKLINIINMWSEFFKLCVKWRNSTLCFESTPERRNENIAINNYLIPRVGIEPTTCRVYSHTLVPLRNNWPRIHICLLNKIYLYKLIDIKERIIACCSRL